VLPGGNIKTSFCQGKRSAWAEHNGLVLGQLQVADKSNEITAVPQLLRVLELSGCIVTVDAMGCQKKIAREIVEADADYVLALKGNQETVHEEVKTFLDQTLAEQQGPRLPGAKLSPAAATLATWETVEKDHGRLETRRYYQSPQLAWFANLEKWEGLRSVGLVETTREIDGQQTVERRYYLSSLPLGVQPFARAGYAAENLATLRRLALNMLRREKTKKRGIKGKPLNAGWNHAYLLQLLGV
jgi:predicted transposase YbfD/YdcC